MKKLGSIIALLLIITVCAWFYLANEFEKIITQELLPKIKNNGSVIEINSDSIVIDKFKFKTTFKDIKFLPKIKNIQLVVSELVAYHNPFTNKITLSLKGDKVSFGSGSTAVYIPTPDQFISFNRSLLQDDSGDFDITITSDNSSLYFDVDDQFISRAKDLKLTVSVTKDKEESSLIKMNFDARKAESNPMLAYITHLFEKLTSTSIQETMSSRYDADIFNYYYKIIEATAPLDYSTEYSIKLNKDILNNIIVTLKGEESFSNLSAYFKLHNKDSFITIKESFSNAFMKDSFYLNFLSKEKNIKGTMKMASSKKYTDAQKQKIASIQCDLLYSTMHQFSANEKIKFVGTPEDFLPMSIALTDIKNFTTDIEFDYGVESPGRAYSIKIGLDDFHAELDAKRNFTYDTTIKTPKLLIDGLTSLYENALKSLIEKNRTTENSDSIDSFNKMMVNLKDNGLQAISALHSDKELKENDTFKSSIYFNAQNFDLKINDKAFLEILTDARVMKFFQSMVIDAAYPNKIIGMTATQGKSQNKNSSVSTENTEQPKKDSADEAKNKKTIQDETAEDDSKEDKSSENEIINKKASQND